jgi:hypothetical protein
MDATPEAGGALLSALLVLLAAATALGVRRRSRLAVGLVLLLFVLGFEANLHAVHHLDDPTAECPVAAATAHLTDTLLEDVATDPKVVPAPYSVTPRRPALVAQRPLAPHAGRAPPARIG